MDKALPSRRDELLELAATMFAERGLRATTVRDIADSAGILSGSLYHHFKSKEQMVDEVLRGLPRLAVRRATSEIVDDRAESAGTCSKACSWPRSRRSDTDTRRSSSIRTRPSVCPHCRSSASSTSATESSARCGWTYSIRASSEGYFRPDLDVDLVYRFIRDTTWVSVRWYQPGGPLTAEQVGQQYLVDRAWRNT